MEVLEPERRVTPQCVAERGSLGLREQVRAERGGPDRVRFGRHEILAVDEAGSRPREAEAEEQAEQPEHRALERPELAVVRGGLCVRHAEAPRTENGQQKAPEERERDADLEENPVDRATILQAPRSDQDPRQYPVGTA